MVRHGHARFTVITPVCIRLEYDPQRRFIDAPSLFAVNREARCPDFTVTQSAEDPRRITLDTGAIALTFTADDRPFYENIEAAFAAGGGTGAWSASMPNSPSANLGGTLDSLDRLNGPVHLGEGLLSRDGWYRIDDSRTPLLVDDWVSPRPDAAGSDWYLFAYGHDYRAALQALTAIGGPVPLPRKYLLGCWYSRWHAYTSQEYRALVDEYDRHRYPLDVLVWDMDWHRQDAEDGEGWAWTKGWTGFSWNRALLPDAEALLRELGERGIAVTLNVHPHDGIRKHEDMYGAFMQDLGRDPASGEQVPFDAGDRRYMEAYFKHAHRPLEDAGVAFWWVDWQQNILIPWVRSLPGLRHQPWLNALYSRQTARDNRRGVSFSRWAGWGDHRHPIHFSGDAASTWAMLAFEVPYTATAGNCGCFFWSHDMGGFCGCDDAERYARWLQFGAFSAAMRLHGVGSDRRPWTWPDWVQPSLRRSFDWRSRFMPYTYSSVVQSCRESVPLIRATYLARPGDAAAYRNPQQYGYGEALLAAPVVSPGSGPGRVGRQVVYIPEGTWYHALSGERLDGPAERLVCAGIEELPLFVKGGVPVPMQPYCLRPGSAVAETLVVRCFPGPEGGEERFVLFEDDGVSGAYRSGACAGTTLRYRREGQRVCVTLEASQGSYRGMPEQRAIRLELPLAECCGAVTVNGSPATAARAEEEGLPLTVVEVPSQSVRQALEIVVICRCREDAACRADARARRCRGLLPPGQVERPPEAVLREAVAAGETPLLEALLALWGVGAVRKAESLYRDGEAPVLKFYAAPGVLEDEQVHLELLDRDGRRLSAVTFRGPQYPFVVPVPGTVDPQSLQLGVTLRIDGVEVHYTTSGYQI